MGKILRLHYDGSIPQDNPFVDYISDNPLVDDVGVYGIELDGDRAREVERYDMGARIRSVIEGPDGALWVLEDERAGSGGRLLKLTPEG